MTGLRAPSAVREPTAVRSTAPAGPRSDAGNQSTAAGGSGRPLSDVVRARMESAFGADFSDVRIRQDDAPSAVDALALT
ncbi:MAG: eCIS core domain-containing protein, partial [Blastococcus sp.]